MPDWEGIKLDVRFDPDKVMVERGFYSGIRSPEGMRDHVENEPWNEVVTEHNLVIFTWGEDIENGFCVLQAFIKEEE